MLALVLRRLGLREVPAAPGVRVCAWASATVAVACLGAIAVQLGPPWLVGVFGVASLVALGSGVLVVLPPAMAVTVVGIALSCASLVTALSVTDGFRREMLGAIARINGHVLLTKYGLDFFEYEALARQWTADPRVRAASPFAYSMAAIVGPVSDPRHPAASREEAGLQPPSVVVAKGVDPAAAAELAGFRELLARGDLAVLRPGDGRHAPGIVLGEGLAARVGVAPGDLVRVVVPAELESQSDDPHRPPRWANFEVLDVLRSGTSELDRNFALMHLSAAQAVFFQEGRVTGIEFQLVDPDEAADVASDMQARLGFPYRTSTWQQTNAALLVTIEQVRLTLMAVLGLMVVVSTASLVSTLLLVVRRKRGDIAVLQTLGADGGLVFWLFESLGVAAGLAGALLGIALGLLWCAGVALLRFPLGTDVYPVDHLPVWIDAGDTFGPAAVAVSLCALVSGPVAMLASRVGVLEALRDA